MKRTKERFGKLDSYNQEGVSGLKVFDGEDLEYQDRIKLQQIQQKNWIENKSTKNNNVNFQKGKKIKCSLNKHYQLTE